MKPVLHTGQTLCYDVKGEEVACGGTGQDGEIRPGLPWPDPRFRGTGETVQDNLTGLEWTRKANFTEFPLEWVEGLEFVGRMNRDAYAGHRDWRLPNRRELRSLISYQARDPALPRPNPFQDVFLGWYWTSTTAAINPAYAWYVHLEGGRMFYGRKTEFRLVWPVRGTGKGVLPVTGQQRCFDESGHPTPCAGTGQDRDLQMGAGWPQPRFLPSGSTVLDRLTGLNWTRCADLAARWTSWEEAFRVVEDLNAEPRGNGALWRLPTINELESLVDASCHSPALPTDHPFRDVQEAYWSSTSSGFEPDWCMALYMYKGAVGVGQKKDKNFSVWAVQRSANEKDRE